MKFNVIHFEIIAFCLKILFSNQYLISYVLTKQKMSKYCVSLNFYSACFMMYLRIRVVVITSKTTKVSFQNVSLSLKSINLLSGLGAPFFFRAMIISYFGKPNALGRKNVKPGHHLVFNLDILEAVLLVILRLSECFGL